MSAPVTQYFTEGHRLSWLNPASRQNGEYFTGWVSMRDYHKATALLNVGAIAANGVVDALLIQATDTNGTGVKTIGGKSITSLTDVDDNKVVAVELDSSELDVDNGYDCINFQVNIGGHAAVLCQAYLIRHQPRFSTVGTDNLDEVVT